MFVKVLERIRLLLFLVLYVRAACYAYEASKINYSVARDGNTAEDFLFIRRVSDGRSSFVDPTVHCAVVLMV